MLTRGALYYDEGATLDDLREAGALTAERIVRRVFGSARTRPHSRLINALKLAALRGRSSRRLGACAPRGARGARVLALAGGVRVRVTKL